jgi:hypothetical protein
MEFPVIAQQTAACNLSTDHWLAKIQGFGQSGSAPRDATAQPGTSQCGIFQPFAWPNAEALPRQRRLHRNNTEEVSRERDCDGRMMRSGEGASAPREGAVAVGR